ncbi:hypothetical protein FNF29_07309 [Cafeteria roenbergensis]|uniref:Uncharacterized protein n=1 Tax=Cafeteria roenbergensis TaxID=33653 RepID=A0A5A8C4C5_CAFRO|nr:hypothetical protein FNF29_07309 [Cafeteria roenbergensis]|eukprot:KAA0147564.1 hypothetical protein FNF29_07309 [Cafeteria roenbergensis]
MSGAFLQDPSGALPFVAQRLILEHDGERIPSSAATWSHDGVLLAVGGGNGALGCVSVWRRRAGGCAGSAMVPAPVLHLGGFCGSVTCVAWIGHRWLAAGATDGQVRVWALDEGSSAEPARARTLASVSHPDAVTAVCSAGRGSVEAKLAPAGAAAGVAGRQSRMSAPLPPRRVSGSPASHRTGGAASVDGSARADTPASVTAPPPPRSRASEPTALEDAAPSAGGVGGSSAAQLGPASETASAAGLGSPPLLSAAPPSRMPSPVVGDPGTWSLPRTMVTACCDGRVRSWGGPCRLDSVARLRATPLSLAWSRRNDALCVGEPAGEVQMLQLEAGGGGLSFVTRAECRNRRGPFRLGAPVVGAHFHPRGRAILVTTLDGRSRVLVTEDATALRPVLKLRGGGGTTLRCAAQFSPAGGLVAGGTEAGALVLWRAAPEGCDPALVEALVPRSARSPAVTPVAPPPSRSPARAVVKADPFGRLSLGSASIAAVAWCPGAGRQLEDGSHLLAASDVRGVVFVVGLPAA